MLMLFVLSLNYPAVVVTLFFWLWCVGNIGAELPCVVALAKNKEEVYIAGCTGPVNKGYDLDGPAMRLLRHARDEAHRSALSHHRMSRTVQMVKTKPKAGR